MPGGLGGRGWPEPLRPALTEEQQLIAQELGEAMNQLGLDTIRQLVAMAREQASGHHGQTPNAPRGGSHD